MSLNETYALKTGERKRKHICISIVYVNCVVYIVVTGEQIIYKRGLDALILHCYLRPLILSFHFMTRMLPLFG